MAAMRESMSTTFPSRFRRGWWVLLGAVVFSLAACGPSRNLVLVDPVLPAMNPKEASEYGSFRFGIRGGTVLEYPVRDFRAFLEQSRENHDPRAILLSPLLAVEYPAVRTSFPEAWILGLGLPEEDRTITAAWDPSPACREAGRLAGEFLQGSRQGAHEPREVVFVSLEDDGDCPPSENAFLEGLLPVVPDPPLRRRTIPPKPGAEDLDALTADLSGPGVRGVFINAGAQGLRIVRSLDARRSAGKAAAGADPVLYIVLRMPNHDVPNDVPADIVIFGDTRNLLAAFRKALSAGRAASLLVPESLRRLAGAKP